MFPRFGSWGTVLSFGQGTEQLFPGTSSQQFEIWLLWNGWVSAVVAGSGEPPATGVGLTLGHGRCRVLPGVMVDLSAKKQRQQVSSPFLSPLRRYGPSIAYAVSFLIDLTRGAIK